jgi:hypothetical protein
MNPFPQPFLHKQVRKEMKEDICSMYGLWISIKSKRWHFLGSVAVSCFLIFLEREYETYLG